jgi:hypothetical protein
VRREAVTIDAMILLFGERNVRIAVVIAVPIAVVILLLG